MIEISKLSICDTGKWVRYTDGFKVEVGRIKGWNDKVIFVVYRCDGEWHRYREFTGAGTNPEDLRFIDSPLPKITVPEDMKKDFTSRVLLEAWETATNKRIDEINQEDIAKGEVKHE